jgi:alkyl hydroperoxide reductase subunit AhpF
MGHIVSQIKGSSLFLRFLKMDPKEKAYIQEWNRTLTDDVALELIVTDDERSQAFRSFADRLGRLAPRLKIGEKRADAIEMPAFLVQKRTISNQCPLPFWTVDIAGPGPCP